MPDTVLSQERRDGVGARGQPFYLQDIPSAAYVVQNDEDLTLLAANEPFYRLFGCTQEEMRSKYGNRLGALLDEDSLRGLTNLTEGKKAAFTGMKQHIKRKGGEAWLYTEISLHESRKDSAFFCVSFEMTREELENRELCRFRDTIRYVSGQVGFDFFEYDLQARSARVYSAQSLLPGQVEGVQEECPDFVERMAISGFLCAGYERPFREAFQAVRKEGDRAVCELQVNTGGQSAAWVRLTLVVKQEGPSAGRCAVGILEDITRHKEVALNYLNETQFYQAILSEKDAYGQVDVTEDRITRIGGMWNLYNELISQLAYTEIIEQFINRVVHPEDRAHYLELMQRSNFIDSLENGIDRLGCEFRRIVEQNKMVWMELSVHLFRDPLTRHVLALIYIKDIDAKKKQELLLLRNSRLDQLTNVYNKTMAETLIKEYLEQAAPEELCAFVIVDLDNFKQINDSYGHKAGDQILVQVADVLSRAFRKSDIIGRFGGDEFILFLKNIGSKERVRERLEIMDSQLQKQGESKVSCSMGVALLQGPVPYGRAFSQADTALYDAKNAGKSCFRFYKEDCPGSVHPPVSGTPQEQPFQEFLFLENSEGAPEGAGMPFSDFVAAYGDIAYLVSPETFDLICGNKAFYDRIGLTEAQCLGMKCYEVMQKRESPCPFCSRANWSTDKFYMWRNMNTALEQEFIIKNKLVPWQGREVLLALAIDISNNKSIVDSIESDGAESYRIISGVQRMSGAEKLSDAMLSALETIGYFFRADAVRFWAYLEPTGRYECTYSWSKDGVKRDPSVGRHEVNAWMQGGHWGQTVMLESPEAMLCYSYEMYQYMKANHVLNQRWIRVKEGGQEMGCICVDNLSCNYQNLSFLESFSIFIASEMKKRSLIEGALQAGLQDDLTGLLSRKSFEAFMSDYDPDQVSCIGVVIANFNNLKKINGTQGFRTGNYLIRQFSDYLRETFRQKSIFRLNGDEFLVFAPDTGRTEMEEQIGKLEAMVRGNGSFSVSIGYSWDDVENDLSVLMEQATQAMKVNKKRHYDSIPASVDIVRRSMLSNLVASIENREFEVFLQPKVELRHGGIVGAEALIRYRHKEHGLIPPNQFIDILEKNSLIRYVDLFVFEEVCKLLEAWKKQGVKLPAISLNFSRLTLLERDILSSMETIISRYDAPRPSIEIEITESVANMGKSILYQAACDLYEAGFAISLDDFGTKYTNLSILADLNFSVLKLDRSLVGALETQPSHRIILKNVISMCRELGIEVIAEGIETEEQARILQEMECRLGQGYLYGKPMPVEEFQSKYITLDRA